MFRVRAFIPFLLRTMLIVSRKLSWSKNGCIARISADGYTIKLTPFARDAETGKWDLQKDVDLKVPQGRDEFPFVHLSWSHLGNDLAVMDAVGRVMIFSCNMCLDRMTHIRTEVAQPEAEVDGVVGMHWLAIHPYEAKVRLSVLVEVSETNARRIILHGQQLVRVTGGNGT